jgi:hypothetical protein
VTALYPPAQTTGNPTADRLYAVLQQRGQITRGDAHRITSGHLSAEQLDSAVGVLIEQGLAVEVVEQTGGKPRQVIHLTD